jgi:hypothetical protein
MFEGFEIRLVLGFQITREGRKKLENKWSNMISSTMKY